MRKSWRLALFVTLLVPAAIVACEASTPARGGQCSTGPAHAPGSIPPAGERSTSAALECVPRCGAAQKYTYVGVEAYAIDALPSGACEDEGAACHMRAGTTAECPGEPTRLCNLSGYECRCTGGAWSCAVVSQGAGTCGGCGDAGAPGADPDASASGAEPDASADAALDGADVPRAATPAFSPLPGTFTSGVCVSITSDTPGATIHFTVDGSAPTPASPTAPPLLAVSTTSAIRAIATADGLAPSAMAEALYTIHVFPASPSPVTFAPGGGTYADGVDVVLASESTPNVICYTLDGSLPTCEAGMPIPAACSAPGEPKLACTGASLTYDPVAQLTVPAPPDGGSVTVRAVACTPGLGSASDVLSATYVFAP